MGQVKNVLHPDKVKKAAKKVYGDYIKSPLQKGYTYFKNYTKKLGDVKTPLTYEAATPLGSIKVPKTVSEVAQDLKKATVQMAKKLDEKVGGKRTGNDSKDFEKPLVKLPPAERVAAVKAKAQEVAKNASLVKDSKLSKINRREVYKDPKTGDLYSVDTQHGRFEKTNSKGKHLGEVDFDFMPTKPADASGGHNLKVK